MNNYSTELKIVQLNSEEIVTGLPYQREINPSKVEKIVKDFNPNLVNPLKVSFRDGKYYIFDGQHTLAALRVRNGGKHLLVNCRVYYGLTYKDEANLFVKQNGYSTPPGKKEEIKGLYEAEDGEALLMFDTLKSLGLELSPNGHKGENMICAYAKIWRIYKKTNQKEFIDILTIIKGAWGGSAESFNAEILGGVFWLYMVFANEINVKKAIRQFNKAKIEEIIRDGRGSLYKGDKSYAIPLGIAYNHNLKSGRLLLGRLDLAKV